MLTTLSPERVIDRVRVRVCALHDKRESYVRVQQQRLDPMRFMRDYVPRVIALFRFAHGPLAALR